MLSLLGQHRPCFLFRQIFLQQLPEHVRTPLAVSDTSDYSALALEANFSLLAVPGNLTPHWTSLLNALKWGPMLMLPAGTTKITATRPRNAYPLAQNSSVRGTRETPGRANSSISVCWPARSTTFHYRCQHRASFPGGYRSSSFCHSPQRCSTGNMYSLARLCRR